MYLYYPDLTIMEVAKRLDETGLGVIVFTDENKKLIGIVTDGDLRRAFLSQRKCLQEFINLHPRFENAYKSKTELEHLLKVQGMKYLPLVDSDGCFTELFLLNDVRVHHHENYVVIMAGGLGSRLGSLTKEVPKPMLPVGGKPILQRIIELFREQGFHRFIFCVNYKSEVIKEYFGTGAAFGVEIQYIQEQKRMGTAGALSLIPEGVITAPFLLTNADVITTVDYTDLINFHVKMEAKATMCVKKYENQIPYACVEFDTDHFNLMDVKEKPSTVHYINTGIYAFHPSVIQMIPKDEFYDVPSLFLKMMEENMSLKAYPVEDHWIDIGQPFDYQQANLLFTNFSGKE